MDKSNIFSQKLGEIEVFLRRKSQFNDEISGALTILRSALQKAPVEKSEIKMGKNQSSPDLPIQGKLKQLNCHYYLFSDGGCRGNPGPGAYFSFIQASDESVLDSAQGFSEETTNNRMELQGVTEGLKMILKQEKNKKPVDSKILICTDSKYVLDGLKSWRHGWKARGWKKADKKEVLNKEQWMELDELIEKFTDVEYFWVKGHSQFPQNEYCDQMCNEIMDSEAE